MNNKYIFYLLAFRLVELLSAAGVIFWVACLWHDKPDSAIVRFSNT